MALIPCPECEQDVSDRALACPHCGFPVAEAINQELVELTGVGHARSARQQAAAEKLQTWANRYVEGAPAQGGLVIKGRNKAILGVIVFVIVVLQLVILSAFLRGG